MIEDNVDLLLTLEQHGWSTGHLYVGEKIYEITISHSFGDPMQDLVEACIEVLRGNDSCFDWYGEPGGYRWKFSIDRQKGHLLNVEILEFDGCFGDEVTTYDNFLSFKIKTKQFMTIVYYQLLKTEVLLQDKSFQEKRKGEFPTEKFSEMKRIMEGR